MYNYIKTHVFETFEYIFRIKFDVKYLFLFKSKYNIVQYVYFAIYMRKYLNLINIVTANHYIALIYSKIH